MRIETYAKYAYLLKIYGELSYPLKVKIPENLHVGFFRNSYGENIYESVYNYNTDYIWDH